MAKGSAFERGICKELSRWWTNNEREDVFWRSASSGAMATQRSKLGKRSFGQAGDVQAHDPIGQPLIDFCAIELKRGYSKDTVQDLVDRLPSNAISNHEKWIKQSLKAQEVSGSYTWLLIVRRDRRKALTFYPQELKDILLVKPTLTIRISIKNERMRIFATTLGDFFKQANPKTIKDLLNVFHK